MSNLRQAAQQALEALETNNKAWKHLADSGDAGFWEAEEQPFYEISVKAITALRAALAEPDSDYERGFVDGMNLQTKGSVDKAVNRMAEPEQEPVAWMYPHQLKEVSEYGRGGLGVRAYSGPSSPNLVPVYTAPTPRKPLTDKEIEVAAKSVPAAVYELMYGHEITVEKFRAALAEFARAIERAHGIGGDA